MPIARDEARMLGLLADDEATICWAMGFASAQPALVWGCGSQEAIIAAISFSKRGISVSWFGRGCFFVPATILQSAARSRRQGWPAPVVARRIAPYRGSAFTTAIPVRSLMVGTIDRARRRR